MPLTPKTLDNQLKLADYCRTGETQDIEGLTPNRVHHYRRLIFNIALDTLSTAFPITLKLLGQEQWEMVIEKFYAESKCTSPYVWKMPEDFYEFFKTQASQSPLIKVYPFLFDLLYFELVELNMYMMEDEILPHCNKEGHLEQDKIVVHPESKVILLEYPVHIKAPETITANDKGQYYCLCFREPTERKILFFDLSAYLAFVIEQLFQKRDLNSITEEASASLGVDKKTLVQNTLPFLENLVSKGFIMGYSS